MSAGDLTPTGVLAVVVLYRRRPEESESLISFRECLPAAEGRLRFGLLVWDNSPSAQQAPEMPGVHVRYLSDPANPGLAAAYAEGLRLAQAAGMDWLLLLDQDTVLTEDYLRELGETLAAVPGAVGAVVPKLLHAGGVHSPHPRPRWAHRGVAADRFGVAVEELSAFNSGAVLRVSALKSMGGFPAAFPMEYLDHALFYGLWRRGWKVWVLRAALRHELSTLRLGDAMPLDRYGRMLAAERRFYDERGGADQVWSRVRRLKQAAAHLLEVRDKRFAWMDLKAVFGL